MTLTRLQVISICFYVLTVVTIRFKYRLFLWVRKCFLFKYRRTKVFPFTHPLKEMSTHRSTWTLFTSLVRSRSPTPSLSFGVTEVETVEKINSRFLRRKESKWRPFFRCTWSFRTVQLPSSRSMKSHLNFSTNF